MIRIFHGTLKFIEIDISMSINETSLELIHKHSFNYATITDLKNCNTDTIFCKVEHVYSLF